MIGIIAAMKAEVEACLPYMQDVAQVEKQGVSFWTGKLSQKDVVLMLSGVGKGNAAMSTTILMTQFHPSHILNIGTAGGLCKEQEVLDLVVSTQVVQHDFDTSMLDGEEGIGLYYEADASLVKACERVFAQAKERFHIGLVASGDQFIAEESKLKGLLEKFPTAQCAEMEAGAIAQVAYHFNIPFVVVRSLSDVAWKEKSHLDFCEYVHMASARSATLCEAVVKEVKEN